MYYNNCCQNCGFMSSTYWTMSIDDGSELSSPKLTEKLDFRFLSFNLGTRILWSVVLTQVGFHHSHYFSTTIKPKTLSSVIFVAWDPTLLFTGPLKILWIHLVLEGREEGLGMSRQACWSILTERSEQKTLTLASRLFFVAKQVKYWACSEMGMFWNCNTPWPRLWTSHQ